MHHGYGNLNKAINLLNKEDRKDFFDYCNKSISYNPHIMFIAKPNIVNTWFEALFPWLLRCEKEFGLGDTAGVADYHQAWWENFVDKKSPTTLDNATKMGLVKRWAFMDKGFRLDKKNITDEKTLEWAKKTDKDDQKKIGKKNLMKFEQIFLGLGAEVLEFTSSALTVNADSAVRDMKKRIDKTIKDVKKSGDPKKIEKLKLELGRLKSIGGSKKIVPNEGIVFLYKGNTFKLTGTFASVNQILGIFF